MTLVPRSTFSQQKVEEWVKNHKYALLVSSLLALTWWNLASSYRWFYDVESLDFRRLTLEHINTLLKKQKLSSAWECIYSENTLGIWVIYCLLGNGDHFWPQSYELKWLNKAMYVCTNLRLEANWILDIKSGTCYRWRMTILGTPQYLDRNGNVIDPNFIPWKSYSLPNQANQW